MIANKSKLRSTKKIEVHVEDGESVVSCKEDRELLMFAKALTLKLKYLVSTTLVFPAGYYYVPLSAVLVCNPCT